MSKFISKYVKQCSCLREVNITRLFGPILYYNSSQLLFSTSRWPLNRPKVDKSKVPVIDEKDLKEEFIHGSGPGGQNVNKLSNCVQLTHLPSGIVVKCHQHREQKRNRVVARELLRDKLDKLINGEDSVSAQRHRLITDRYDRRNAKREKLRDLKTEYKARLQLEQQAEEDKSR